MCIVSTVHQSGSASDLQMAWKSHPFHKKELRDVIRDFHLPNEGVLEEVVDDYWDKLAKEANQS